MAMMCKQAWRLLQNPNSLCAKLLQAKYYNDRSVLDAKPSSGMSYSWRSIMQGVELLKKGIIWHVGDAANLNMWSDPWLPRDMSS